MGRPLDEDAIQRLCEGAKAELEQLESKNLARNQRLMWIQEEKRGEQDAAEEDIDSLEGQRQAEENLLEEGVTSQQQHDEAIRDIDAEVEARQREKQRVVESLERVSNETIESFNETAKAIRTKRSEVQRYEDMLEAIDETSPPSSEGGELEPVVADA